MAIASIRYLPALLLALALPVAAQTSASNTASAKEASTAAAHAGMAFAAKDMKTTQMHLHHVVNCLVGPGGSGFDAAQADPCKGMGQGAIVDAKGEATTEARLNSALASAQAGLAATSLTTANADASKAMSTLQKQ